MAATLAGDDLASSMSTRWMSFASASRKSFPSTSICEVWTGQMNVFQRGVRQNDEDELKWAAIERLPTYDRLWKGILKQVLDNDRVGYEEVDVTN